jgi:mono/diheme cytochrome c family protein
MPVLGTIARGRMPMHLQPGPEGAALAAIELHNPFLGDAASAMGAPTPDPERGAELFRIYCLLCHGPTGEGEGPVAQRGFPTPPSLLAANALQMSDGQLFHVASVGQGNMPAHSSQIDPLERWRIVQHIRRLQAPAMAAARQAASADSKSEQSEGPPEGGQQEGEG